MRELPKGWVEAPLGDVIEPKETRNPSTDGTETFRYLDVKAVDNSKNRIGVVPEVAGCNAPSRARRLVKEHDVLFCLVRPYLRNIALVPPAFDGEVASTAFCVLRATGSITSRFLFYQVLRDSFVDSVPTYGNSPPAAREDEFLELRIGLPPVPEQHRIVARIEALFARLEDAVEALKRAEANLERYRASVLKAAVEGRLTARWRNENPPDETGEKLLRRSLAERRKCWEQEQLAKFVDRGRKPPGNWKSKYKEPVAPDTRALPELPVGWCWATVDQMGDVGSGITKGGRKRVADRRPVPYLRVANVQRGGLDLTEIKTIPASETEIRRYSLRSGDVLFNEGGDRDKLGRGCVWRGEIQECLHQNHVFRVRPFLRDYSPDFLSHFGNSSGQEWFFRRATQSVNLASINQTVLRSLPVPVPPAGEQEQIVARVAHELANVERRTMEMGNASAKAASLRQSVLKRAFEGRLVPQDPADEPASVLLDRIRAEREVHVASAGASR